MIAKQLTFGDWVMCDNRPSRIVNLISEENDIADIENDEEYGTFFISAMQPIPLTREIIIKNGLKRKVTRDFHGKYHTHWEWESKEPYGNITLKFMKNAKKERRWFAFLDSDYSGLSKDIGSVHQLQHLIREAEIEKQITL